MRTRKLLLLLSGTVANVAAAAVLLTPREAKADALEEGCKDKGCWVDSTACFYLQGGTCHPSTELGTCYVVPCGDS